MEIKDNTFSRQFETYIDNKLLTIEYSFQDRKIFLTKLNTPEEFDDEEKIAVFIRMILSQAEEKKLKVVPTHSKIVAFFRKNPTYKSLLPPGIRI